MDLEVEWVVTLTKTHQIQRKVLVWKYLTLRHTKHTICHLCHTEKQKK